MNLNRLFYSPSINDPNLAWKSYINMQSSIDDVVKEIKSQNKQNSQIENRTFGDYISSNNDLVNRTNRILENAFENIESLQYELGEISSKVGNLEQNLIDLTQIIDYKLSLILEQNKITNFLLNHITYLLKIPDSEKEKSKNIEVGLKHFKNAKFTKSLYKDSLVFFKKAEKIDHTDFIALYYIGMIYLYGDKCINLSKARNYFLEAGKYSEVESNEAASKLIMLLKYSTDIEVNENILSSDYLIKFAAESYYHAGIASFVLEDFSSSKLFAKKAIELNPQFQIAHILFCRALIKNNDAYTAIEHLSEYLPKNPIIYDIISSDPVFIENTEVAYFLKKLKEDLRDKVLSIIESLEEIKVTKQRGRKNVWIYEAPWFDEYLKGVKLFTNGAFDDLINAYDLFYKKDVMNLSIPWYFDSNRMYFNKRLVHYASSPFLSYIIFSINNYISIYKNSVLIKSLISHEGFIKDICITNDDKYFFTCGLDNSIQLYDLVEGKLLKKFKFDSGILRIAVSSDDKKLALYDSIAIQIYDIDFQDLSLKPFWSVNTEGIYHCNLDFSPNTNYLAYFDSNKHKINVLDIGLNEIFKEIDCSKISMTGSFLARSVKFSHDSNLIAIAGENGTIIVYDVISEQYTILKPVDHVITKLFFNENDSFIIGDSNEEFITWEIKSGQIVSRNDGYNNFIYGITSDSIDYEEIDLFDDSYKNLVQYINFDLAIMYGRIEVKDQE